MGIRAALRRMWRGKSELPARVENDAKYTEVRSIRPQDILPESWTDRPQNPTWDSSSAVTDGMEASTWVYTAVSKNASSVASLPWFVERREGKGKWVRDDNTALAPILAAPNEAHAWKDLVEIMTAQTWLAGNTLLAKSRVTDPRTKQKIVAELWPVGPHGVAPIPGGKGQAWLTGYEYQNEHGRKVTLAAKDTIHVRFHHPSNPYWGLSPVMAGAQAINSDTAAADWQANSLANMMVPPGAFVYERNVSEAQVAAAKTKIRETGQYAGSANARSPLFLGGNAKWVPMTLTPQELDYLNSRRFTREEIVALFAVPPPLVGIYDKATFANIATAERIYWETNVTPFAQKLCNAFNRFLVPEYADDLRLAIDTGGVLALLTRLGEKLEIAAKLFAMGVPFNSINERLGLGFEPIDGGEQGWIAGNLQPADGIGALGDL